jgi:hypothetical protein
VGMGDDIVWLPVAAVWAAAQRIVG